jgi:hypothetical protein
MPKADELQNIINQTSLMMNVDADVSRALKEAGTHPDLAQVIMRMHGTQVDMDTEIKALRKTLAILVQSITINAQYAERVNTALANLSRVTNVRMDDLFTPQPQEQQQ